MDIYFLPAVVYRFQLNFSFYTFNHSHSQAKFCVLPIWTFPPWSKPAFKPLIHEWVLIILSSSVFYLFFYSNITLVCKRRREREKERKKKKKIFAPNTSFHDVCACDFIGANEYKWREPRFLWLWRQWIACHFLQHFLQRCRQILPYRWANWQAWDSFCLIPLHPSPLLINK